MTVFIIVSLVGLWSLVLWSSLMPAMGSSVDQSKAENSFAEVMQGQFSKPEYNAKPNMT